MLDPRQTFIDVTVRLGRDVTIYPGTILQGDTIVGDRTDLGPDAQFDNCRIGDDCVVSHTVAVDASVGDGATVGPYAHLPPGANVVAGAVTGAFYTAPVPD
jgi:bifunctional UDP-N-acetylglucosamine pyrophosphorylase/glucosamine-1-phosphate N-acetyltransferase